MHQPAQTVSTLLQAFVRQQIVCHVLLPRASQFWACFAGSNALEAEWRRECLAFARVRNLAHVQEMRMLYVVRPAPHESVLEQEHIHCLTTQQAVTQASLFNFHAMQARM